MLGLRSHRPRAAPGRDRGRPGRQGVDQDRARARPRPRDRRPPLRGPGPGLRGGRRARDDRAGDERAAEEPRGAGGLVARLPGHGIAAGAAADHPLPLPGAALRTHPARGPGAAPGRAPRRRPRRRAPPGGAVRRQPRRRAGVRDRGLPRHARPAAGRADPAAVGGPAGADGLRAAPGRHRGRHAGRRRPALDPARRRGRARGRAGGVPPEPRRRRRHRHPRRGAAGRPRPRARATSPRRRAPRSG